eukprot:jgi/Tetstr1/430372/TSEL_020185.t2
MFSFGIGMADESTPLPSGATLEASLPPRDQLVVCHPASSAGRPSRDRRIPYRTQTYTVAGLPVGALPATEGALMAFPVDTSDWRATLDSIVAATDNNLRAIRGLSESGGRRTPPRGGNGTPASPISVPSTPPPWPAAAPSQDAVYNAAVLGKLQDRQLHAARGELTALLTSVQSSLSELRVEVSAAKKLSGGAAGGGQGGGRVGPRFGDAPVDSRLDGLEEQLLTLQRAVRQQGGEGGGGTPAGGRTSPTGDDGALGKLQKRYKSLDKRVVELDTQLGEVAEVQAAQKELDARLQAGPHLEGALKDQIAQMIRDALKESELSMQSKLHDLAHAVLEEQQTGAQQRMIDAIKGGLQDTALKIDEIEGRLDELATRPAAREVPAPKDSLETLQNMNKLQEHVHALEAAQRDAAAALEASRKEGNAKLEAALAALKAGHEEAGAALEVRVAALEGGHKEAAARVEGRLAALEGGREEGVTAVEFESRLGALEGGWEEAAARVEDRLAALEGGREETVAGVESRLAALESGQKGAVAAAEMEGRLAALEGGREEAMAALEGRLAALEGGREEAMAALEGRLSAALEGGREEAMAGVEGRMAALESGQKEAVAVLEARLSAAEESAEELAASTEAAEAAAAEAREAVATLVADAEDAAARLVALEGGQKAVAAAVAANKEDVDGRLEALEEALEGMPEPMDHDVEGLEARLEAAEGRLAGAEGAVAGLEGRLTGAEELVSGLVATGARGESKEQEAPPQQGDEVASQLAALAEQLADAEAVATALKGDHEALEEAAGALAGRVEGLEGRLRRGEELTGSQSELLEAVSMRLDAMERAAADRLRHSEELAARVALLAEDGGVMPEELRAEVAEAKASADAASALAASVQTKLAALQAAHRDAAPAAVGDQSPKAGESSPAVTPRAAQNMDRLTLKVNAMANGMLALEDALSGVNERLDSLREEQGAAQGQAEGLAAVLERLDKLEAGGPDRMELDTSAGGGELGARLAELEAAAAAQADMLAAVEAELALGGQEPGSLRAKVEELERLLAELSDPAAPGTEPRAPPAAAMQAVEDALQARLGGRDEEVRARLDGLAEQIEWLHREGGAGAGGAVEERLRALEARSALRTSSAQPLAQDGGGGGEEAGGARLGALESGLAELRAALEELSGDTDIMLAGAKRAAEAAETDAREALEGVEEAVLSFASLKEAVEALQKGAPPQPGGGRDTGGDRDGGLLAEVESLKMAVMALEEGEASRMLSGNPPELSASAVGDPSTPPQAQQQQQQQQLAEELVQALRSAAREAAAARVDVESAAASAGRNAAAAARAATAATGAAASLEGALPALAAALGGLLPELAELGGALAAGRGASEAELAELGAELAAVRSEAAGRLGALRGAASEAAEALTELNAANAEAHAAAMADHLGALETAEAHATELETELESARTQVESLSGLLQSMEAPAVGESRSGHFGRQMAYMMGVLQAKAREVAALREGGAAATGGGGDSRLAEEVDALEEAYGAETVAAWAAIEEFREELMRFDTELASAVGSLQAEVADVRLRAEAGKRGGVPPAPPSSYAPSSSPQPTPTRDSQSTTPGGPASPQFPSPVVRHLNPVFAREAPSPTGLTPDALDRTRDNPMYDSDGSNGSSGSGRSGGSAFAAAHSLADLSRSDGQSAPRDVSALSASAGDTVLRGSTTFGAAPDGAPAKEEEEEEDQQEEVEPPSRQQQASPLGLGATPPLVGATARQAGVGEKPEEAEAEDDGGLDSTAEEVVADAIAGASGELDAAAAAGAARPALRTDASGDEEEEEEEEEAEGEGEGEQLPISPPARTEAGMARPPGSPFKGEASQSADDSASEIATESVATDIYTEDEEFLEEAEAEGAQTPPPQAKEDEPAGDDAVSASPSVKERMRMFGGAQPESPATARRLSGIPHVGSDAPRSAARDTGPSSGIPAPRAAPESTPQQEPEPSDEEAEDLPTQGRSPFKSAPAQEGEASGPPAEMADEEFSVGSNDEEVETEADDEVTPMKEKSGSRYLAFRDEIGSLSSKGLNALEVAEEGSPEGGDLNSGGSVHGGDAMDVGVEVDYGDVDGAASDDLEMLDMPAEDTQLVVDSDACMSDDLELDLGGLELLESPMSAPRGDRDSPMGAAALESSDLTISGDLEQDDGPEDEDALFEELEDIQAQLGKPGLADFQRELLEERRAEVEDKLATIEGMTSADLGGGDDGDAVKSAEELKIEERIRQKQAELAAADDFDKEFIESDIDDLKLDLRQIKMARRAS